MSIFTGSAVALVTPFWRMEMWIMLSSRSL